MKKTIDKTITLDDRESQIVQHSLIHRRVEVQNALSAMRRIRDLHNCGDSITLKDR